MQTKGVQVCVKRALNTCSLRGNQYVELSVTDVDKLIWQLPHGEKKSLPSVSVQKSASANFKAAMCKAMANVASNLESLLVEFKVTVQGIACGNTKPRPTKWIRNRVSRIFYQIMEQDEWSPAIFRRLKTVGDKLSGVLHIILESGQTAST